MVEKRWRFLNVRNSYALLCNRSNTCLTISALPTAATTMSARRTVAKKNLKWNNIYIRINCAFTDEEGSAKMWIVQCATIGFCYASSFQSSYESQKSLCYQSNIALLTFNIGCAGVCDSDGCVSLHEKKRYWDACSIEQSKDRTSGISRTTKPNVLTVEHNLHKSVRQECNDDELRGNLSHLSLTYNVGSAKDNSLLALDHNTTAVK